MVNGKKFGPEHAAMIDSLKGQLLIVFLRKLGGKISVPVAEIDATEGASFAFKIADGMFHFEVIETGLTAAAKCPKCGDKTPLSYEATVDVWTGACDECGFDIGAQINAMGKGGGDVLEN